MYSWTVMEPTARGLWFTYRPHGHRTSMFNSLFSEHFDNLSFCKLRYLGCYLIISRKLVPLEPTVPTAATSVPVEPEPAAVTSSRAACAWRGGQGTSAIVTSTSVTWRAHVSGVKARGPGVSTLMEGSGVSVTRATPWTTTLAVKVMNAICNAYSI